MGAEVTMMRSTIVIPAKAGIQSRNVETLLHRSEFWIPAFAGMTEHY
jgi:hypothetical protein